MQRERNPYDQEGPSFGAVWEIDEYEDGYDDRDDYACACDLFSAQDYAYSEDTIVADDDAYDDGNYDLGYERSTYDCPIRQGEYDEDAPDSCASSGSWKKSQYDCACDLFRDGRENYAGISLKHPSGNIKLPKWEDDEEEEVWMDDETFLG